MPGISHKKSKLFAIRIIRLYQFLNSRKKEFLLSKQILRSGTAIGALLREVVLR
jgi:four helix bundle protein